MSFENYFLFENNNENNNNNNDNDSYFNFDFNDDKYLFGLNENPNDKEEFVEINTKTKRIRETGGKDENELFEQYLKHIRENSDKHTYSVRIKTFPRKKQRNFEIKSADMFDKDEIIKSIHNDLDAIFNKNINDGKIYINKFKITFEEKSKDDKKIRKPRTKKVFKILDENIIQKRNSSFQPAFNLYPIFISTEKENDINLLFPLLNDNNNYNTFVDVFFGTGNFYFFMNMENNYINIPNLPTYAFFRALQRGEGKNINKCITGNNDVNVITEKQYEQFRFELNNLLKEYNNNINNERLENQIAPLYYFLSKNVNKQTLKYRNQQVISKYNNNNIFMCRDPALENFYLLNLLKHTTILYTEEYYNLIVECDDPKTIIFIDLMRKTLDYYKPIGYDEEKFYNLFIVAQSCIILVLPNTYFNRELFHDYIKDIKDYKNDRKNYSLNRTINTKKQLIISNKKKYF
jgi:hypothetical protein